MKYPDYLDLAEFHTRRWFDGHGLPTEPMLCICDGEHGLFTRSAACSADAQDRAAMRREIRAEYAPSGVTKAFLMSPVRARGPQGEDLGPGLVIVTYEQDAPDRSRAIPVGVDGKLEAEALQLAPEGVYSPFPNLLTGLRRDKHKGPAGSRRVHAD